MGLRIETTNDGSRQALRFLDSCIEKYGVFVLYKLVSFQGIKVCLEGVRWFGNNNNNNNNNNTLSFEWSFGSDLQNYGTLWELINLGGELIAKEVAKRAEYSSVGKIC
jgi:hypothetical protein